jgi:hypothetical protein
MLLKSGLKKEMSVKKEGLREKVLEKGLREKVYDRR